MINKGTNNLSESAAMAKARLGIVGNDPALAAAIERAVKVAPVDFSVLVTGESGTGKEFFPQIIHSNGARKHSRYIAVNCGAIPEGTIDSELFGHEKGAFTGAVDARKGYFEEADGGTIFLDEVAELPLTTQARLLRVLETGEYLRVGSSSVKKTNVRIVAATNVDLLRAIEEGKFREDLYYRLATVQIKVPPLRDRGYDIRLLARKFAADFAEKYRRNPVEFSEEAELFMRHYRWPGNVRQLKNVVDQIALFEAGAVVDIPTLRRYIPDAADGYVPVAVEKAHSYERERDMLLSMLFNLQRRVDALEQQLDTQKPVQNSTSLIVAPKVDENVPPCSDIEYDEVRSETPGAPRTLEDNERSMIADALARNDGRRKAAASDLRISERTLYRKIKEYGLE